MILAPELARGCPRAVYSTSYQFHSRAKRKRGDGGEGERGKGGEDEPIAPPNMLVLSLGSPSSLLTDKN